MPDLVPMTLDPQGSAEVSVGTIITVDAQVGEITRSDPRTGQVVVSLIDFPTAAQRAAADTWRSRSLGAFAAGRTADLDVRDSHPPD